MKDYNHSNMKIEDIYLQLLFEQPVPEDQDGQPDQTNQPGHPKRLSANQVMMLKLKEKWQRENPNIHEDEIENMINFFNARKNGIRPIKEPPTPGTPNQLEIVAMKIRFPQMASILTDPVKIRDINNYTWEQISYYSDRANAVEIEEQISYDIDETSEKTQFDTAMQKWEAWPKKIINEPDFLVLKVECKEESMALGRLQNLLASKYGGSAWCITYRPDRYGHLSNNWTTYRKQGRAFYFILDKTKNISHQHYVGSIETKERGGHNYTPRPNGTNFNISWNEIVEIYPKLQGRENLFPYFGLTPKEKGSVTLDSINFIESTEDNPNPNDFVLQPKSIQQRYVEDPTRQVINKRAFSVLTADLRKSYIGATTFDNYKKRFGCDDQNDPFGILNLIFQDKALLKSLDWKLKNEIQPKVPEGVIAIQKSILKLGLREGFTDADKKYALFKQRDGNKYGVMNMSTIEWVNPMGYEKTEAFSLYNRDEKGKPIEHRMYRYALGTTNWFYFMFLRSALTDVKGNTRWLGKYFSKEEGDEFLNNLSNYGFKLLGKKKDTE